MQRSTIFARFDFRIRLLRGFTRLTLHDGHRGEQLRIQTLQSLEVHIREIDR